MRVGTISRAARGVARRRFGTTVAAAAAILVLAAVPATATHHGHSGFGSYSDCNPLKGGNYHSSVSYYVGYTDAWYTNGNCGVVRVTISWWTGSYWTQKSATDSGLSGYVSTSTPWVSEYHGSRHYAFNYGLALTIS